MLSHFDQRLPHNLIITYLYKVVVDFRSFSRSIFAFVVALMCFPFLSWSDEYIMVMSKEDRVCQHMLREFNKDLKSGDIRFEAYEEFNVIKWEKKYYVRRYQGHEDISSFFVSEFDINNDGKKEIVVKGESYLRGWPTDYMDIFKIEDKKYFNDVFDIKNNDKRIGSVGTFDKNLYCLKEIPERSQKSWDRYYCLGPIFNIEPFFYDGSYYLNMIGEYVIGESEYPRSWDVIMKYGIDNSLVDICYFFRAIDCSKQRHK